MLFSLEAILCLKILRRNDNLRNYASVLVSVIIMKFYIIPSINRHCRIRLVAIDKVGLHSIDEINGIQLGTGIVDQSIQEEDFFPLNR